MACKRSGVQVPYPPLFCKFLPQLALSCFMLVRSAKDGSKDYLLG